MSELKEHLAHHYDLEHDEPDGISWLFVGEINGQVIAIFGLTEEEAELIGDDVEADINEEFADIFPEGILTNWATNCMRTQIDANGQPVWDGLTPIQWRRGTLVDLDQIGMTLQHAWQCLDHPVCGMVLPTAWYYANCEH